MTTTTQTAPAGTRVHRAKGPSLDSLWTRLLLQPSGRPQRRAFARTVAGYPATRSAARLALPTHRTRG